MNKMYMICAVDQNWAIGNKGDLLIRIPEDLKDRFKALTLNTTVVMGKKTLISLPGSKGLPQRENCVFSRDINFRAENAVVYHSLKDFFDYADTIDGDVFVIGGAEIYNQLLPYCNGAYITKIYDKYEADAFVANLDSLPCWSVVAKQEKFTSVAGVDCQYIDYINNDVKKFSI